jgi:hypothetical protein
MRFCLAALFMYAIYIKYYKLWDGWPLAATAFGVRIQTSPKNRKLGCIQRSGQHTLARQKIIQQTDYKLASLWYNVKSKNMYDTEYNP